MSARVTLARSPTKPRADRRLVDLMLSTGALAGPYRRTRPINPGLLARLLRVLRAGLTNLKRKNPWK